jgi:hypothetical protein
LFDLIVGSSSLQVQTVQLEVTAKRGLLLARLFAYGKIVNAVGLPTQARPRMRGYSPRNCGFSSNTLNPSIEVRQVAFIIVPCFSN